MKDAFRVASLLGASILFGSAMGASPARADLHFLESRANAGAVPTGTRLVHRFSFVNEGAEKAVIAQLRISCGCLAPRLERRDYLPGERGTIELEVNTLTQGAGLHIWTLHVAYLVGHSSREQEIELRAQMIPEIGVQPSTLVVHAEHVDNHKILLTDRRSKHLEVVQLRTSTPHLTARLGGWVERSGECSTTGPGRWQVEICLQIGSSLPPGWHDEELHIYTDDSAYADLKIPVTILAGARERFSATPGEVRLSIPRTGSIPARIVQLRDSANEPVKVEQVLADDPALICTWSDGPGVLATLKIRVVRSRLDNKGLESAVHVQIRSPERSMLTIPVHLSEP